MYVTPLQPIGSIEQSTSDRAFLTDTAEAGRCKSNGRMISYSSLGQEWQQPLKPQHLVHMLHRALCRTGACATNDHYWQAAATLWDVN